MKIKRMSGERGFLRLIIIIIVALLVISYFGINIRQVVESPTTKDNFAYTATTTVSVWNNYLKTPVTYVWDKIFVELIWKPAIANLGNQVMGTSTPVR